jgi:hypothetical protein
MSVSGRTAMPAPMRACPTGETTDESESGHSGEERGRDWENESEEHKRTSMA